MENIPDEQLMAAFSKGDQTAFADRSNSELAFSELYRRHKAPLYRYFLRQLGHHNNDRSKAEELYQDVWYRVIDKRESYQPTAKFTTWLYRIAHNLLIDEHRKKMSEQGYQAEVSDNEQQPEEPALPDQKERNKSAIKQCMEHLAPLQREAFLLRHDAGFETAQICDIVQAKPEAVKTRLRYALDQLRQCLTRKLGERK